MSKVKLVRKGYNKIAKEYFKARDQFKSHKYLEQLNLSLKLNSLILDIGCGAGKPIDEFLVKHGHRVIGIDVSKKMIGLARKNVPEGNFEVKDMAELKEGEYSVDAVVSFYAIFHIPRKQHKALFQKIHSFLPRRGLILVTLGSKAWEGTEDDFFGAKMFWSHFGKEKNRKMIEEAGFKILLDEIDTSGGEKHQVILARRA